MPSCWPRWRRPASPRGWCVRPRACTSYRTRRASSGLGMRRARLSACRGPAGEAAGAAWGARAIRYSQPMPRPDLLLPLLPMLVGPVPKAERDQFTLMYAVVLVALMVVVG